jgi:glycosyltransferase involved in cell wall biosynthesis
LAEDPERLAKPRSKNVKILHIGNTAGVGSVIAKYMDRLFGTDSLVVARRVSDPVGFTTYGELWNTGSKMFTLRCLLIARKFDVVHVHYFDKIIPYLKLLYSKKPVVMHYHGDDIREKWKLKSKYWRKADAVLYSTLDLNETDTPRHAMHLPNPVDTEIFYPCHKKPEPGTAFHLFYHANELAQTYARENGLRLTIHDWRNEDRIPHEKLPEILCKYEYYIDARRGQDRALLRVPLSKTALEALACGLKVITWSGSVVYELPPENYPEGASKRALSIYLSLLKTTRN